MNTPTVILEGSTESIAEQQYWQPLHFSPDIKIGPGEMIRTSTIKLLNGEISCDVYSMRHASTLNILG